MERAEGFGSLYGPLRCCVGDDYLVVVVAVVVRAGAFADGGVRGLSVRVD
jgi:hypothetical protein